MHSYEQLTLEMNVILRKISVCNVTVCIGKLKSIQYILALFRTYLNCGLYSNVIYSEMQKNMTENDQGQEEI